MKHNILMRQVRFTQYILNGFFEFGLFFKLNPVFTVCIITINTFHNYFFLTIFEFGRDPAI